MERRKNNFLTRTSQTEGKQTAYIIVVLLIRCWSTSLKSLVKSLFIWIGCKLKSCCCCVQHLNSAIDRLNFVAFLSGQDHHKVVVPIPIDTHLLQMYYSIRVCVNWRIQNVFDGKSHSFDTVTSQARLITTEIVYWKELKSLHLILWKQPAQQRNFNWFF